MEDVKYIFRYRVVIDHRGEYYYTPWDDDETAVKNVLLALSQLSGYDDASIIMETECEDIPN